MGVKILNRKSRRLLQKAIKAAVKKKSVKERIKDGDRVLLNVDRIVGRKDYSHKTADYKRFVEANRDKTFVARAYRESNDKFSAIFQLEGVEDWLFWFGDLLPEKESESGEGE